MTSRSALLSAAAMGNSAALLIDILAIADGAHLNDEHIIVDLIDDPIAADSNAPQVFRSAQLFAAGRPWGLSERFDAREHSAEYFIRKALELLPGGTDEPNGVLRHSASNGRHGPGATEQPRATHAVPAHDCGPSQRRQNPPTTRDYAEGRSPPPCGARRRREGTSLRGVSSWLQCNGLSYRCLTIGYR
jgi:hypothetical protein